MKIKILRIICVIFFGYFLLSSRAFANRGANGCYDTNDCNGSCGAGHCEATPGCKDPRGEYTKGFIYFCLAGSSRDKVSLERDFLLGIIPISFKPNYDNISMFISSILPNIYIISGIILLFLLIGGGFAIMSSTSDPQKKGQGGKAITAAIIGFLIIFASYWIIQIIEKITGAPILNYSGKGI